jgi:uncharacterized protein DUF3800
MGYDDTYCLYIDESGDANLNHPGKYFVLSAVLIKKNDFEIIEGYLRLLKRKFLGNDQKLIHTTDLFERPYMSYRKLISPRSKINLFIKELQGVLDTIPYQVGLYYVNKDIMRKNLSYLPAPRKRTPNINLDLPYEKCSLEAIYDFTRFLISKHASGEIIIESRFTEDSNFVRYFDTTRKVQLPGGVRNHLAKEVMQRVNTLVIGNKRTFNGGLELADICSYSTYRGLVGDPKFSLKVDRRLLTKLQNTVKNHVYVKGNRGRKLKELY